MKFFCYDRQLCNSSISSALRRLIRYRTCPADRYYTFYYVCFGAILCGFDELSNHLHLPLWKRLKPLAENYVKLLFFYDFFSPSSRLESHHLIALLPQRWHQVLLFCSSAMCKNVILPYHEPNMQPFIQWLPVFICSASVGLSASRHQYLEWGFQCWHR